MADDDLLQKADALMRRRRIFVAGAATTDAAPESDDDVPLLTEIVAPDGLPETTSATVDVAAMRAALVAELESWLDESLPAHVQRVLDGVTDQLIIQLSARAREELLPRLQGLLAEAQRATGPGFADE